MNLLKAAATVSGFTLLSRITGLIRENLTASIFGASALTDAFFVAFRIPNLLRRLFAEGAFSQAFVPILAEYRNRQSPEETRGLVDAVGTVLFLVLLAAAAQFFPASLLGWVQLLGALQFLGNTLLVLFIDDLLVLTLNYAPVMLLLLAANTRGLRTGTGSWPMVFGLLLLLVAAGVQASGFDALVPLDHNGLYHLVSMAGVWCLFLAGKQLKRA